jgi:hypothetical protein
VKRLDASHPRLFKSTASDRKEHVVNLTILTSTRCVAVDPNILLDFKPRLVTETQVVVPKNTA